jgi:hypothetical protein
MSRLTAKIYDFVQESPSQKPVLMDDLTLYPKNEEISKLSVGSGDCSI